MKMSNLKKLYLHINQLLRLYQCPSPKGFGLWSLPESSQGPQTLAHLRYDNKQFFMEKKLLIFQFFLFNIFSFSTNDKIFALFGQKRLLCTRRATSLIEE